MVTDGGVKLLDFGLAKLRERGETPAAGSPLDDQPTGVAISPEGTLVGTIAYMSPEQLEGRVVDARTDIYALGLIVYEMITGHRAFAKGQPGGTDRGDPQRRSAADDDAPAEDASGRRAHHHHRPRQGSGEALAGCRRSRARVVVGHHRFRYDDWKRQTAPVPSPVWRPWTIAAGAVIVAAIGTTGIVWRMRDADSAIRNPQSTIRNLVVLPCRASGDAVTQAYCDGLTDTLSAKLTPLAVARGLQLTSTVEVRGRGVHDAAQARREFGATLILEGAILRADDMLRINYVLVDATTLQQIDAYLSHRGGGGSVRPPGSGHFVGHGRAGHAVERRRAADAERVRNTCARGSRSVS